MKLRIKRSIVQKGLMDEYWTPSDMKQSLSLFIPKRLPENSVVKQTQNGFTIIVKRENFEYYLRFTYSGLPKTNGYRYVNPRYYNNRGYPVGGHLWDYMITKKFTVDEPMFQMRPGEMRVIKKSKCYTSEIAKIAADWARRLR